MLATSTSFEDFALSSLFSGCALDSVRALGLVTFEVEDAVGFAREADFLAGYVHSMPLDWQRLHVGWLPLHLSCTLLELVPALELGMSSNYLPFCACSTYMLRGDIAYWRV
jgi:hypothetical protein